MRLNKVNLCWVLSEGQKGHEIQSMTVAQRLATQTKLHTFKLRQPWKLVAPKIIPGFQYGHQWHTKKPDFSHSPDIIISTGRQAAAMGKFVTHFFRKAKFQPKHIQILNPKDNTDNYDLLLVPEHDQITGTNIINFKGSLHPFDTQWFKTSDRNPSTQAGALTVIIGNPAPDYFKHEFALEVQKIRTLYPQHPILFCGSPRLDEAVLTQIKGLFKPGDSGWFNQQDGPNPYQNALRHAKHLFVTADSINMMNECASSKAPVTLLAMHQRSNPKHQRFIESMAYRWQDFNHDSKQTIQPIPYALDQIMADARIQKLLNTPSSSIGG